MKMSSKKRYDLLDLTFEQLEVICLGLEEINDPEIESEQVLIAKRLRYDIDEELKNE